ncbi:Site-specific recombinase XerD [Thiohalomonas denitrificans]|uniref:Site-specific recombinase XerD n=1 Tax=Thiohalomonas denitrificans TaxID=415747 RepID=A0A1G5PUB5_9GAMM|nr:Site-specific recombinase XerD [Thiohalomonas denitrificans]
MIRKQSNGKWLADVRPNGRDGKRYRKQFKTKGEAERWSAWITTGKTRDKEWEPKKKDRRKLGQLIDLWWDSHGHHLKDGERRRQVLRNLDQNLGTPIASDFTSTDFSAYRTQRLETGTSPATLNREHAYLRAIFNELARLDLWHEPNPLAKLRQFKVDETELTYLTDDQIITLLIALDTGEYADAGLIARICLATGARWSEAETLRAEQVHPNRIDYGRTKSGKNRSVPISDCLYRTLADIGPGRLFADSYNGFRRAINDLEWELPRGQLTHVLRHTFASAFMQRGGNILTLQRLLGHASLTMTMRYAHLSPDHLTQALDLNPLA